MSRFKSIGPTNPVPPAPPTRPTRPAPTTSTTAAASDDPEAACKTHLAEMRAAAEPQQDRGSRVESAAVVGIEAVPIEVETSLSSGLPAVVIVGLPDAAVKESRDRVRAAIKACAGKWPEQRITLNLAPGDLRKEGPSFDLPVALGILTASGKLADAQVAGIVAVGELALDGAVRSVRGVLPIAIACRAAGKRLMLPAANAREASVVEGLEVLPVSSLDQAMLALQGRGEWASPPPRQLEFTQRTGRPLGDFNEVRGQSPAIRALTLAAAGGHNALLIGPPGTGKSMLSQRMPTILPPLSPDEALEVTAVYSVCGLLPNGVGLVHERPFRAPHHSISGPGLVGGGSVPRPGEVSLAHHGVLFLDEMSEFPRHILEELRQPIEDGQVTIGRAACTTTFPANVMLVGASNPCPCGYLGAPGNRCTCTPRMIERYRRRLSGPLLDRIDIHVEVPLIAPDSLVYDRDQGAASEELRAQVMAARVRQSERFAEHPGVNTNAQMGPQLVRTHCTLSDTARRALEEAMRLLQLSARAYGRILKLARTIADLDTAPDASAPDAISDDALFEAIQYRALDRRVGA